MGEAPLFGIRSEALAHSEQRMWRTQHVVRDVGWQQLGQRRGSACCACGPITTKTGS